MVITLLQHIAYVDCCCWISVKVKSSSLYVWHNHNVNRKTPRADMHIVTSHSVV